MKKTILMVSMLGVLFSQISRADEDILLAQNNQTPNERIGPQVQIPENPMPESKDGPLANQGQWLVDHGITPHLTFIQLYFANPGVGVETDQSESVSIFTVGASLDLEKMIGLSGGTIHYEHLFAPWIHNLNYGMQASSTIVGTLGPYIPKTSHLTLFTYEQKLLDDKLTLEAGKSNAGNYFALPMCNSPTLCVSATLQNIVGINPPPYANWSARMAYDLSPKLRVQTGWWRSDAAFPFTNGWESNSGDIGGQMSNVYLANMSYRTDFSMEKYPLSYEVMGFYNDGKQTNPYYTVNHTSKVFDTSSAVDTTSGVSGIYLGAKKTLWRADHGESDSSVPKSISAYASMTQTFNDENTKGIQNQGNAGILFHHMFESRPFDSYGLSFQWAHLTDAEQNFLQDANLAAGGSGYTIGQTETALALDANFILSKGIILSPFVMYSWDSNSMLNPYSAVNPESGVSFGATLHMKLDQILGLSGKTAH